jgi:hypothetical protein
VKAANSGHCLFCNVTLVSFALASLELTDLLTFCTSTVASAQEAFLRAWALFSFGRIRHFAQCHVKSAHCSILFVFGKNYLNFD